MGALKAHEVARFLARPRADAGIFLAYGPDAGLVRETIRILATTFAGAGDEAGSVVTLDGGEIDADPALLAVEVKTVSLFGEKRIIRVRGTSKSLVTTLKEIIGELGDTKILIEAGNLTPKDALRALVEAQSTALALPCYADSDETLNTLFRETFAQHNIRIDPEVVQILRENLGNDREITRRELEKLTLYAADSKQLTAEQVLELCADNGATIVDAIIDAMGTGHPEKLEISLGRALNSGVEAQRLLRSASLHFAQLRQWRTAVDSGKSIREVLASARPKPHFSRTALVEQQLRLWSDTALAAVNERLQQATRDSRRQPVLSESIVQRTFLALCMMAATR
ncbi:DNA polymerase III subunit delta [Devosia rhodophyticola]|uniref:DNA-directed DNA polymerase n=1 Tax=Devosia rhodophyticola TaxID=3026423 RepID=A0ABY7Z1F1_9HYPH|nr:DNA polymerase III subunit delta [Devosia rhodophyticola]WDR07387.1 DNA polymerase III subunit delta [Devosia rhodophyticola]